MAMCVWYKQQNDIEWMNEWNVLFNDTLNMFYIGL